MPAVSDQPDNAEPNAEPNALAAELQKRFAAVFAASPRPTERHGIKPVVKDSEDAERAGLEISWCNELQESIAAISAAAVKEITELAAAALFYDEAGERVPIKQRRTELEEPVFKWAEKKRGTLCPGKKKSVKLRHMDIKWRDGKDSVDRLEGVEAKDVKEKLAELTIGERHESATIIVDGGDEIDLMAWPLAACVHKLLGLFGYCGAITLTPDVNRTAALDAYKLKEITAEDLAAIDHEFKRGEETITILPAKYLREGV